MSKHLETINVAQELEKTRGLERDLTYELVSSRRLAWRVCLFMGVLTLASVLAG